MLTKRQYKSSTEELLVLILKVTNLSATNSFECIMPYFQGGEVNPEMLGCLILVLFGASFTRS